MANKVSVLIDVTVDKANRALAGFKKSVAEADGAVGKFKAGSKSAFASLKANAVPVAAAAGAAMFAFGRQAVEAASNLEQSVGGIEKAFGDAADAVLAIGENAEESMGLSQRAFNEGALALSAFAEDIARDTGQPVAKVIEDLMTRAADFAAAYGTTVPEAVRIFSSTLSGESEPIKRFGIIVNETETKAYAAEAGIEDMGKATQRAGLLMQDTAKFAGQFAEESDTLAGRQERLSAKIENLQATLGEELLPVVADVVGGVGDLVDVWNVLADSPPVELVMKVTGDDSALSSVKTLLDYGSNLGFVRLAADKIGDTFSKLNNLTVETTGTIGDLTGATRRSSGAMVQAEIDAALLASGAMQVSESADEAAGSTQSAAGAAADAEREFEALRGKMVELREEFLELTEAQAELVGAEVDVERATLAYQDAMISARMEIDATEVGTRAHMDAVLDAKDAIRDQASVLADAEIAQREANNETLTAQERNNILADKYDYLATDAIPEAAGAARGWASDLRDIPENVESTVAMNTSRADATLAAWLSRPRTMRIDTQVNMNAPRSLTPGTYRKTGGPVPGRQDQAVPITAHGGEYVLDAGTVDAIKKGQPSAGKNTGTSSGGGGMDAKSFGREAAREFAKTLQHERRAI